MPDSAVPVPLGKWSDRILPDLDALYRDLHRHPELSGAEVRTAGILAAQLDGSGYRVATSGGGPGVVGFLSRGNGPVVMVRTDMDGLPIREETGLPYASTDMALSGGTTVPVMHACGHDLHMADFAGTARLLAREDCTWSGTLLFVAQPAEETGEGARAMIHDGLFSRFPVPQSALTLHADPVLPAGTVGSRPGILSAGSHSLEAVIRGVSGHGAHPHRARDPVVIAAQAVLALQTVVSREIDPREVAVLTIGAIHGGSRNNIIPPEVRMSINLRFNSAEVRDAMEAAVRRILAGIAQAAGVPEDLAPVVTPVTDPLPPLVNDPHLTARVMQAIARELGKTNVVEIGQLTGSEDFGVYREALPSLRLCTFRLGVADPARARPAGTGSREPPDLHSSRFAPVAGPAIRTGVTAMAAAALDLLGSGEG